jgi:hypothetical protein
MLIVSLSPLSSLVPSWFPYLTSKLQRGRPTERSKRALVPSMTYCPRELSNAQNTYRSVASTCSPLHTHEIPTFAPSDMGGQRTKTPSHTLTSLSVVGSGTTTPRHDTSRRGTAKRKQTLLSLLDALNELTNDEEAFSKGEPPPFVLARINGSAVLESNLQPSFRDDRDVREWF